MDIRSGKDYPSCALSNFAAHPFVIDGVHCTSMEGFLQSLKFKSIEMQRFVCTLRGQDAKSRGKYKNWHKSQTLYWQGKPIKRDSQEYQDLLDRAYNTLAENSDFQKALLATGDAVLQHSIGKTNPRETVLTRQEFVSRLTKIRSELQKQQRPH